MCRICRICKICRLCKGSFFLTSFAAPGMSWQYNVPFSFFAMNTRRDYCGTYEKRMCTPAEICPNGRGQQSVIGISGPDRVLFTIAREYFKADTCEKAQGITNQNEDRNGLLCCPKEKPRPRNPIQNGTFILLTPIPF